MLYSIILKYPSSDPKHELFDLLENAIAARTWFILAHQYRIKSLELQAKNMIGLIKDELGEIK